MSVASVTHRANGPLSANSGFELPLTNLAAAAAIAASGPGIYRLGPHLSRKLTAFSILVGGTLAAVSVGKLLSAPPRSAPAEDAAEGGSSDAEE
jgi:hypothetical protein